MKQQDALFTPFEFGDLVVSNRIVMAPMTRNRALPDGDVPSDLNAEYYGQRASAGLIISEATQISPEGKGYIYTPGIYSDAQVAGWGKVTNAVHEKGGLIFAQLWHVGRISHSSLLPDGQVPVAPSAIAAQAKTVTSAGFVDTSKPRALETEEIPEIVKSYQAAAEQANSAGFDGIELHAANGYLQDQFLRDSTNIRTDKYGGSILNRVRFLAETIEALLKVFPASRVGVRFSPFSSINDISDSDPMATFSAAIKQANEFRLSYLHLVEGQSQGSRELPEGECVSKLRELFDGAYIANNGYDFDLASSAVSRGAAALVAFGRPYISNPDLVERFRAGAALIEPDKSTFYGGCERGYTDYPLMSA